MRGFRPWLVRFQFCFPKVASLIRFPPVVSKPKLFHQAVCCNRGCSEELLLLLLPAVAQSLVIPQQVVALPIPHSSKDMWLILRRSSVSSCGRRDFLNSKVHNLPDRLTRSVSRVCDQHFARFERPVGKGPRGLPKKSSTTLLRAAIFMCAEEANKPYAYFGCFPCEMRVCGYAFHCIHWKICSINNIILVVIEV